MAREIKSIHWTTNQVTASSKELRYCDEFIEITYRQAGKIVQQDFLSIDSRIKAALIDLGWTPPADK